MASKLRRPFGLVWSVAPAPTSQFVAPIGWVIGDLQLSGLANSGMRLEATGNRTKATVTIPAAAEMVSSGGWPGIMFDFATPTYYFDNGAVLRWENIGFHELRSLLFENGDSWSTFNVVIGGVWVPDPRCVGPEPNKCC